MIELKGLEYGDAHVEYGSEKPRYRALRTAIDQYLQDLLRPLQRARSDIFAILKLPGGAKADGEFFDFSEQQDEAITETVDRLVTELAGPIRTRRRFVEGGLASGASDGIIQQRNVLTWAVGVARASRLLDRDATVSASRQSPAVQQMLDSAFTRLSTGGKLRLEGIRDEIHSMLVTGQDAGISPIEMGRQLAARFEVYQRFEFERLARTEAAFAAEAGTQEQFKEFGVSYVVWLTSAGSCPICLSYVGKLIEITDMENLPPAHPQCGCSISPAVGPGSFW